MRCFRAIMAVLLIAIASVCLSCGGRSEPRQVVVYTSVDQNFSEVILKRFEEETGIRVRAVYDIEAAKTTGLVNRLIAEKGRPQADVFWNGEIVQTLLLQERGVLAPYRSKYAGSIPETFRDPQGYWTGLAGRARCFIVNTDRLKPEQYPRGLSDLLDARYDAQSVGIALPLFGTTATHAAALYRLWGAEKAGAWFRTLRERGVRVVDGNGVVRDMVVSGALAFGLTDTDDAAGALERGAPVTVVFPDQDGSGTLVIPNTVALVAGAPHPEEAKAFIDYLLRPETAAELIRIGWCHVPLRDVGVEPAHLSTSGVRKLEVDFGGMHREIERVKAELREVFGK